MALTLAQAATWDFREVIIVVSLNAARLQPAQDQVPELAMKPSATTGLRGPVAGGYG